MIVNVVSLLDRYHLGLPQTAFLGSVITRPSPRHHLM